MGMMIDIQEVFTFLRDLFDCFPTAIKLLTYGAFGGVVYIAVFRGLGR